MKWRHTTREGKLVQNKIVTNSNTLTANEKDLGKFSSTDEEDDDDEGENEDDDEDDGIVDDHEEDMDEEIDVLNVGSVDD